MSVRTETGVDARVVASCRQPFSLVVLCETSKDSLLNSTNKGTDISFAQQVKLTGYPFSDE
jgi:hypothetical protein